MSPKHLHRYPLGLLITLILLGYTISTSNAYDTAPDCENQIGAWYRGADIPQTHLEGASAVVGDKLYVLGGFESYVGNLFVGTTVSVYDPAANIWETAITPRNPMPFGASHMQAAVQDDRYIWMAGGFYGDNPGVASTKVWRYDTVTDVWSPQVDLPDARAEW